MICEVRVIENHKNRIIVEILRHAGLIDVAMFYLWTDTVFAGVKVAPSISRIIKLTNS